MSAKPPHNDGPDNPSRRESFRTFARHFGVIASGTIFAQAVMLSKTKVAAEVIRPPGALEEDKFTAACIRCGLCVDDCPYDILKLASWSDPVETGTPYFIARQDPCRMCATIPCVKACPTGALDPLLTDIRKADMGVAVLVGHETCLNFKGLTCSICWRVCPIRDEAIVIKPMNDGTRTLLIPTVNSDSCTGCGTCEKHCVLSEAAIRVLPRKLGLGLEGRNAVGR